MRDEFESMEVYNLESLDDQRLEVYVKLTNNQLRNRLDPARALMICESPFVVETALLSGCVPLSFLTNASHLEAVQQLIQNYCSVDDVPIFVLSDNQIVLEQCHSDW